MINGHREKDPFRDIETKNDVERFKLTLELMPPDLSGHALDIGVENHFTPLLKKRYGDLLVSNTNSDVDFDTDELLYVSNSFDVIFSFEVIKHLMNPLFHLIECNRILKPDGKMFVTTPKGVFPEFMWPESHFHEMARYELEKLFERASLKIEKIRTFNKSWLYWLKMGIFRPTLRALIGGWYYVELTKCSK